MSEICEMNEVKGRGDYCCCLCNAFIQKGARSVVVKHWDGEYENDRLCLFCAPYVNEEDDFDPHNDEDDGYLPDCVAAPDGALRVDELGCD